MFALPACYEKLAAIDWSHSLIGVGRALPQGKAKGLRSELEALESGNPAIWSHE